MLLIFIIINTALVVLLLLNSVSVDRVGAGKKGA